MTRPPDHTIPTLAADLDGEVIVPTDPEYGDVRSVWNGLIDERPILIARPGTVDDVVTVVRYADAHGLPIAVRGGGHNVAGSAVADAALMVDLVHLDDVEVDADQRVVRVGGGATWADVDAATQPHGLATPGGVVSDTGIGGLTLGGGIGWLRRRLGMSCDNLVGAELVDAHGNVLTVDGDTDPELLWGLRGGGGNFGIVTRFDFALHPVGPDVSVAIVFHDGARLVDGLQFYRDYTTDLPEAVTSFAICGTVPAEPPFPEAAWGDPYLLFMAVDTVDDGNAADRLRPLREFDDPILDLSGTMPYVEVQQFLDEDYPHGMRYYWKSLDLPELTDAAIGEIAARVGRRPTPLSTVDVWHNGGAMGRIGPEETAFGDRSAPYLLGIEANWEQPADDEANIRWARACFEAMEAHSTGREYLNFPGFLEEGDRSLLAAHGRENLRRLVALKRAHDPHNRFRFHQNVDPATTVDGGT